MCDGGGLAVQIHNGFAGNLVCGDRVVVVWKLLVINDSLVWIDV